MEKQKKVTSKEVNEINIDILYGGPWDEFENNFEEGWGGEPGVYCLANHDHHLEVAALAAHKLSAIYKDQDELYQTDCWEDIAQTAYNRAAQELYPFEKLWPGTAEDDPEFWREHLQGASQEKINQLWKPEWGPFDKKSQVSHNKSSWDLVNELELISTHTINEINDHYSEEDKQWIAELMYELHTNTSMPNFKLISYNRIDHWDETGVHIFGFNLSIKNHLNGADDIDIITAIDEVFGDEIPVGIHIVSKSRVYVLWYYEA